jgi:thioredoxin reductase (NADPH)
MEIAKDFGWQGSHASHMWSTMVDKVQDYIRSLNFGYRVQLRDQNVKYENKLGRFLGPHTLECKDKRGKVMQLTAARFVIAVGGRPTPLSCLGAQLAITSDDLFSLQRHPGKVCVVGAGYVALECAGFLKAVGCDVTVLVRSIALRGFDRDCADMIVDFMRNKVWCA